MSYLALKLELSLNKNIIKLDLLLNKKMLGQTSNPRRSNLIIKRINNFKELNLMEEGKSSPCFNAGLSCL